MPRWTLVLVGVWCLCPTMVAYAADNGSPAPQETAGRRTGVLLLKSGRIAEGRISQTAGGFEVEMQSGRMLIPFGNVQLRALDRRDAYRQLRESMPQNTAAHHVRLAQWCLANQMLDLAQGELKDALELEPENEDARTQLRKLEELLNPDSPLHKQSQESNPRIFEGFEPPEVKSLAGLSREAAQQFATRVQPVLLNKCGNASCHGAGRPDGFQLVAVPGRSGSNRVYVEQNLAQVLKQIDADNPEHSPLLVAPQGNHGHGGQSVFQGRQGAVQMQLLSKWVELVASQQTRLPQSAMAGGSGGVPANASIDSGLAQRTAAAWLQSMPVTSQPAPRSEATQNVLERTLLEQRPDAFDPEIFNNRVRQARGN